MAELGPGSVVAGRWLIRRELGAGGFGCVYLADDLELARPVALKVLADAGRAPDAITRFAQEAKATARLKHPGIVQVYDHGRTGEGDVYIAYEYLPGGTSADRGAATTTGQLGAWGASVAGALATAHRSGILHRDVKPANILLRADGTAVLADFGIAQLAEGAALRTGTGLILGTPGYLAPELWAGSPPSPATDQYALGATLYELHFGVPLQPDPDPAGILARLGRGWAPAWPPPGARRRDPGLERVLARALAPDPAGRFPDLAAMAEALAGPGTGGPPAPAVDRGRTTRLEPGPEPGPAGQPTVPVRGARPPPDPSPARRSPRAAAALLLLGGLATAHLLGRSPPPPPPEPGTAATPAEPSPADEGWAALLAAYRPLAASFGADGDGPAHWPTIAQRDLEIRTRPALHDDPRLELQVGRFLDAMERYFHLAGPGSVPDSNRTRLLEMIGGYLACELAARKGVAESLARERFEFIVDRRTGKGPGEAIDQQEFQARWREIRETAHRLLLRLPAQAPGLGLELALLDALLRAVTEGGGYQGALRRLVAGLDPGLPRRARGYVLEAIDRMLLRNSRDRGIPCDLGADLFARSAGVLVRDPPREPVAARDEAFKVLRIAGSFGLDCPEVAEESIGPTSGVVTLLEGLAKDETLEVPRLLLGHLASRQDRIAGTSWDRYSFPAPLRARLERLQEPARQHLPTRSP